MQMKTGLSSGNYLTKKVGLIMNDILKTLMDEGFTPIENMDESTGFQPITGKYVCRIDSAGRKIGEAKATGNPYDFRVLKLQVSEIIDGDKATNRFIDMTYKSDADGLKKLMNDMFTAGITLEAKSDAELDVALEGLKDKLVNVRCWVWVPDKDRNNNPIPEGDRKGRQQVKIVKEHGKGKASTGGNSVPF